METRSVKHFNKITPVGFQPVNDALCQECSSATNQRWPEGRHHLPLLQGVPVGSAEEAVPPYVSLHPQSFLRLPYKQLEHNNKQTQPKLLQSKQTINSHLRWRGNHLSDWLSSLPTGGLTGWLTEWQSD